MTKKLDEVVDECVAPTVYLMDVLEAISRSTGTPSQTLYERYSSLRTAGFDVVDSITSILDNYT